MSDKLGYEVHHISWLTEELSLHCRFTLRPLVQRSGKTLLGRLIFLLLALVLVELLLVLVDTWRARTPTSKWVTDVIDTYLWQSCHWCCTVWWCCGLGDFWSVVFPIGLGKVLKMNLLFLNVLYQVFHWDVPCHYCLVRVCMGFTMTNSCRLCWIWIFFYILMSQFSWLTTVVFIYKLLLKQLLQIIGVEPSESNILSGGKPGTYLLMAFTEYQVNIC